MKREDFDKYWEKMEHSVQQELLDNSRAFREMILSDGYKLWKKWAEANLQALKDNVVMGETIAEREEARANYFGLHRMVGIAEMLSLVIAELNSEPKPASDGPKQA